MLQVHQHLFILPQKACTTSSPAYQVPRATRLPSCRYLWPCDPNDLIPWTSVVSQAFRVYQFSAKQVGFWHLHLEYSLKVGNLVSVIFKFQKQVKKSHVMRHENVWKVEQRFTVSQNRVFCVVHWNIYLSISLSMTVIQTVESNKVTASLRWNNVLLKVKGEYVGEVCGVMQKIMGNFLWGWAVECSQACTWE